MGSVEKAARQHFAAQKADGRIAKGHPQRDDLERKQQAYEQDSNSTILNLFDNVLFPRRPASGDAKLAAVPLSSARDTKLPFNGEEQIEKSLTTPPAFKLYLDVEKEFDAIRDKAQDLLWPENPDEARWSDMADPVAHATSRRCAGLPALNESRNFKTDDLDWPSRILFVMNASAELPSSSCRLIASVPGDAAFGPKSSKSPDNLR